LSFYKTFSIYTICGFIAKGISFILLPFFTHYLSRSDYGLITIFSNSVYFIAPLMNLGIGETYTVEYPGLDKKNISSFISTSAIVPVIILVVASLSVGLFHPFISRLTGLPATLQYLICLFSFSNFFNEYLFTYFRNRNQPLNFGILTIVKTTLELALAVYFIKFCGDGYIGRVKSMFITTVIIFVFTLLYFIKNGVLNFSISKKWFLLVIKRGVPTIPMFVMVFLLYNTDNYMVNYYHGAAAIGVYGLASQISLLVNFICSSFITPFYPFLYDNLNKGNYVKVMSLVFKYIGFITGIVLLLALVTPLVFDYFIGYKFHGALHYLFLLLLGQYFFSIYLILVGLVFYKKHNSYFYYICPVIIILNIGINYFFIGFLNVSQFAIASALSYFVCLSIVAGTYYKYIYKGTVIYFKWLFKRGDRHNHIIS
jgi:O-antigen/teichoic acid export membrane protein